MKEKKDPVILEAFFSLSFFSFSSTVTRNFSSPIKGKAGRPMKGANRNQNTSAQHEHTAERQSELSAPVHSFHQRLGILSLSHLFVTPTSNQVPVTRAVVNWT